MNRIILLIITVISAFVSADALGLSGSWSGKLDLGAMQLRIVFNISKTDTGQWVCTMDSPDQGAKDIKTVIAVTDDTKVDISVAMINFKYSGELKNGELNGVLSQNGMTLPLNLKQGKPENKRPQEPKAPFPYTTEEVTFSNRNGNATLSGTLTVPNDFDGQNVIIMVTGSGQQNRDEELFGHKPFLVLADYMARHGIASLRYDDRGKGGSTGDVANATTADNKADAAAGIEFLRGSRRFKHIGVLGHSEGGTIAFMLGSGREADFVVSLAGSALRGDSIMVMQNRSFLTTSGVPSAYMDEYCDVLGNVLKYINTEQDSSSVRPFVRKQLSTKALINNRQIEDAFVKMIETANPWYRYFLSFDPSSCISSTSCPVMAINGNKDIQVNAAANLGAIRRLLPADKKNLIKEYAGLNHLFQHCTTGSATEYAQIEETISEEVMGDIVTWINGLK